MLLYVFMALCAGRYAPSNGYQCRLSDDSEDVPRNLDPIDKQIAANANMSGMRRAMKDIVFASRALSIMMCLITFKAEVQPPNWHNSGRTDATWNDHLGQLCEFGVLEELKDIREMKGCSKYFAVRKTEETARSIFNGRKFSQRCAPPPPTNLPDVVRILEALSELQEVSPSISILEGDIRHYFHQLKLNTEIQNYFCVESSEQVYRWRALPMGWSWSPFCAQSIGMGAMLVAMRQCGFDVHDFLSKKRSAASRWCSVV